MDTRNATLVDQASCIAPVGAQCGESPIWDARAGCLRWVDIPNHSVHALDPNSGAVSSISLPCLVSAVLPESGCDTLIVATARGVARLDPGTGAVDWLHDPEPDATGNRLNDCKADPAGNLFAGTMSEGAKGPTGALYRYGPDGIRPVRNGLTISNGLGWSPDARRFYHVDSAPGVIRAYDHDPNTGALCDGHVLARYAPGEGKPDGLCVDSAGNLWVAVWDGARVDCLSPDGAVLRRVAVPAQRPTSCAFGGPDLRTLYITSAAIGIEAPGEDGGIFAIDLPTPGLPTNGVAPDVLRRAAD